MTETLNLGAIAREVIHDSLSPDPTVMVDDFVSRIPSDLYRDALMMLGREYLRNTITNIRSQQNGGAPGGGSRKVEAARLAWKRLLDTPEFVPSVGWLFLRDATADQVLEMAGARAVKAQELDRAADRYRSLAQAMKKAKVAKVADLADDMLETLLGGAA